MTSSPVASLSHPLTAFSHPPTRSSNLLEIPPPHPPVADHLSSKESQFAQFRPSSTQPQPFFVASLSEVAGDDSSKSPRAQVETDRVVSDFRSKYTPSQVQLAKPRTRSHLAEQIAQREQV